MEPGASRLQQLILKFENILLIELTVKWALHYNLWVERDKGFSF